MREPPDWIPRAALTSHSMTEILYGCFHTSEFNEIPDYFFQTVLHLKTEVSTKSWRRATMQGIVEKRNLTEHENIVGLVLSCISFRSRATTGEDKVQHEVKLDWCNETNASEGCIGVRCIT